SHWQLLAELYIWKKQDQQGLQALLKAESLTPDDDGLVEKIAQFHETHDAAKEAEKIWLKLYKKNNKSEIYGLKLINFFLRNAQLQQADQLLTSIKKRSISTTLKIRILDLKVKIWTNQSIPALQIASQIPVGDLPEDLLPFLTDLAVTGGKLDLGERILKRRKTAGEDVLEEQINLFLIRGDAKETRAFLYRNMNDKNPLHLLHYVYQTYRSERDPANQLKIIEQIIEEDRENQEVIDIALEHYIYSQQFERGISFFERLRSQNGENNILHLGLIKLNIEYGRYDHALDLIFRYKGGDFKREVAQFSVATGKYLKRADIEFNAYMDLSNLVVGELKKNDFARIKHSQDQSELILNLTSVILSNHQNTETIELYLEKYFYYMHEGLLISQKLSTSRTI
ncbi:MAG: hypothetical protein GY786_05430, partial [Proteobacteria bacterium]|nr:hypothetical protein [Pseudomonadota bacterium]